MPVSDKFKQAAYAQETGEAPLVLLTIDHPDMAAPIRVTSDPANTYRRISDTVVDSTAGGNDGTLTGAWFLPGKFGSAVHFEPGDELAIPPAAVAGHANFTVECKVRTLVSAVQMVFWAAETDGDGFGNNAEFHLHINGSGRASAFVQGPSILSGGASFTMDSAHFIADGKWHRLALVLDDVVGEALLYVDGAQVQSRSFTPGILNLAAITDVRLGRPEGTLNTRYLDGEIDDPRFWSVARTAQEIADNKDAPLLGTEPGLVGYWKLDDGEPFIHFPFRVTLPDDTEEAVRATLEIDNVDRQIVQAVRSISSPPTVTLEVVLASTPDVVEAGPFVFELQGARYDAAVVRGELAFEPILDLAVPGDVMSPGLFPGLFA